MMASLHFEFDAETRMEITEIFEGEQIIALQMDESDIYINKKQGSELCRRLHKILYVGPSYEELSDLCDKQYVRLEKLEAENEALNEALTDARLQRRL